MGAAHVGVCIIAGAGASSCLPSFFMRTRPAHPKPAGPHQLGCMRLRLPPLPQEPPAPRLLVQVTYPSEPSSRGATQGKRECPYFRPEVLAHLAKSYGVPAFVFRFLFHGDVRQVDPSAPPRLCSAVRWPIIIFSSGLWGSCEMYTQFCRELSSAGAVVVAVEHEDGSGAFAQTCTGEVIEYVKPSKEAKVVDFRRPFLEQRAKELKAVTEILRFLTTRQGLESCATDDTKALAELLQHADANRILLSGHSFGATGVCFYLGHLSSEEQAPYVGALLMDPWSVPLGSGPGSPAKGFPLPFTLLLSQSWADGKIEGTAARELIRAAGPRCLASFAVQGSLHQWVSDTHLMRAPAFLLRKAGIAGQGDLGRCFAATALLLQAMVQALLVPNTTEMLQDLGAAGGILKRFGPELD